MIISKSMLKSWLECPALFKREYIDGLLHKESESELIGKAIHKFIEVFWCYGYNTLSAKTKEFTLNTVDMNLLFDNNADKDSALKSIVSNTKFTTAVENFIDFQKRRFEFLKINNKIDLFLPVLIEQKLENTELEIKGVPDWVDVNVDGSFNVVEIKSNSKFTMGDYVLDLVFYRYLLKNTVGIDAKFGVVYNPVVNEYKKIELTPQMEDNLKKILKMVQLSIKANLYPHFPNCRCCDIV